jgi:lipopolysaccharide transport system permease protein
MREAVRVLRPPRWSIGTLGAQLKRLMSSADLLIVLSGHRVSVRYKQSLLGGLWALLQPLSMMVVFAVVFTRVTPLRLADPVPYPLFAYAGLLPWTFFSGAVSTGTASLVSHAHLLTKVYFPREILPISYIVASLIDFAIGAVTLLALAMFYGTPATPRLLLSLPLLLVLSGFSLACALLLSALQVRVRDVGIALPIVLQLLMFVSPVLYPVHLVPATWRRLYLLNPLAGLIDGFRSSVLGLPLDEVAIASAVIVTFSTLPLAYLAFKQAEVTMADVI